MMRNYRSECGHLENQNDDLKLDIEALEQEVRALNQSVQDIKQERDEYRLALVTLRQMATAGASVKTLLAMVSFLNRVKTGGDDETE